MDTLDSDSLYEERGGVTFCRPILQGDIFEGVVLPGFGDQTHRVQIVTHPCSMRRGPVMNERIQVAPVVGYQNVTDWNEHVRTQPLPDLLEDGQAHATRFVDMTAVSAAALTLENRIASLSHPGIHVLQQRLVKHWTRLDLPVRLFREQSAPTLTEAEMQETWVELALGGRVADVGAVESAAGRFQAWLDENNKERRTLLQNEANHAALRKAVRAEATAP